MCEENLHVSSTLSLRYRPIVNNVAANFLFAELPNDITFTNVYINMQEIKYILNTGKVFSGGIVVWWSGPSPHIKRVPD